MWGTGAMAETSTATRESGLEKRKLSYWAEGPFRWFLSSRTEFGIYAKAQVALGYGQPFWMWTGAETWAMTTTSFAAGYFGFRGTLPFLDLRLGARYTHSYFRSLLPPKDSYDDEDITTPHGPLANYLSLESELAGVLPLLGGFLFPVITFYAMPDVPDGKYLFDESLRGVMKPPFIWGNRIGYVHLFGKHVKAGVLNELIVLPGRGAAIFRMGPAAAVSLTDHLDAQGTISFALSSPDSFNLFHGSFGQLGLIYRMATGDPAPRFP
jgi:hypothetical protein